MTFLTRLLSVTAVAFLMTTPSDAADRLSPLSPRPDWSKLDPYQETITREAFLRELDTIYAPNGAWKGTIEVKADEAIIRSATTQQRLYRLRFAPSAAAAKPLPRYWKAAASTTPAKGKPLAGVTIGIDPGHIGGKWAKMEERWFQIGDAKPVMEGEMTLITARYLAERLKAQGAKVVLVRNSTSPVTSTRPKQLRRAALAELSRMGVRRPRESFNGPADPVKQNSIQWQSELLFYRTSEIRARAIVVNEKIKPDLVLCLHFNAEAWGDPAKPTLTDKNHFHMLVNGNYGPGELALEDVRFDMLLKLLNQGSRDELSLSDHLAASVAKATGLPPYTYKNPKQSIRVTKSPYVWARNLLANRLFQCPVAYFEPHVMNSIAFHEHMQMGDYKGTRPVRGVQRKSIYQEYADAAAEGVVNHFQSSR